MRDTGIPKLLAWRWTPFAALVLGSLSFVGFVTLVIPDQIGGVLDGATAHRLQIGKHFSRTQPPPVTRTGPSLDTVAHEGAIAPPQPESVGTQVATLPVQSYPKRGFSPPLERPEPPPPPPVALPQTVQQPVLAVPPLQEAPPPAPPPEPQAIAAQPEATPAQQPSGVPSN